AVSRSFAESAPRSSAPAGPGGLDPAIPANRDTRSLTHDRRPGDPPASGGATLPRSRMPGLLDVILGYDCNLACDYCTITPAMRSRALTPAAVVEALREGRRRDYDRVAFTGGEPTIRADLLALIKASVRLGYRDIKVQ